MSWAEDAEDIGGYLANQDYIARCCEDAEGDCSICDAKHECDSSDYREEKYHRNRW